MQYIGKGNVNFFFRLSPREAISTRSLFFSVQLHNLIRATLYLMTTLKLDMKRKNIYLGVSKFSQ